MPRRGRLSLTEQRVFFVTTTVANHARLFDSATQFNTLKDIVAAYVKKHDARLLGYALMANHFHLLVAVKGGGPSLSALMRDIKRVSAKIIFPGQGGIWMERFDDVAIYTEEQLRIKLNYIHNNPVKAGMAMSPVDYPFSSAFAWSTSDADPIVTKSLDFDWPSGEDA